MMDLELWQWLLAALGALLVGLGKGGLPGVGNLTVVIFALTFDAKASVGLLLPILISADVVAVTIYRKEVAWRYLWKLLPWMCLGVLAGYATFARMTSEQVQTFIGVIVLLMTALHFLRVWWRRRKVEEEDLFPESRLFSVSMGIIGGFATMIANAAGPVAQLYLLAVKLPKLAFIATGAWCFFLVNLFKVPFQVDLGIIHMESLSVSLSLAPVAMLGALVARRVVRYIRQSWFEALVWSFIILAGVRMLVR